MARYGINIEDWGFSLLYPFQDGRRIMRHPQHAGFWARQECKSTNLSAA